MSSKNTFTATGLFFLKNIHQGVTQDACNTNCASNENSSVNTGTIVGICVALVGCLGILYGCYRWHRRRGAAIAAAPAVPPIPIAAAAAAAAAPTIITPAAATARSHVVVEVSRSASSSI